jgi:DUF971 family protein
VGSNPAGRATRTVFMAAHTPAPINITLHSASRVFEIEFDDGRSFRLPFEFMRVHSPSAEVRGHGPGQGTLQTGKRDVTITEVQPIGHYAVQPLFSDGHSSGIYSWEYLYELGTNQNRLWDEYLQQLKAAGASRDSSAASNASPPGVPGCGHHG